MHTTNHTLTKLISLALFCLGSAYAQAEEAPSPGPFVTEAFACNYKAGKDRDDLLAARDYYVRQAAKANLELAPAVVWHQFKGNSPADFIWLTFHQNLKAFGATTAAETAAPALASVAARFDAVAECTANMGTVRPVFQSPDAAAKDPAFVSSAACNSKGNMSPGDIADLRGHIGEVLGSIDSFKSVFAFSIVPMTASADAPDVFLISAHDNVAGWANRITELQQSEGGQSLSRHFEKTMDCSISLWNSERVVGERPTN